MRRILATMYTINTYGTWLRGDSRGWTDDGELLPPSPPLEASERSRLKHPPFLFSADQCREVGDAIGASLTSRLQVVVHAFAIQSWHAHFVIGETAVAPGDIVKCAKDAARWKLRLNRPLWGDDYDKRFCLSEVEVVARVRYVERHNLELGWEACPWAFVTQYRLG